MNMFLKLSGLLCVLCFANVASACMEEGSCFDSYGGFEAGALGDYQAFGAAMFNGSEGEAATEAGGKSDTVIDLDATTSGCDVDCTNTAFSFDINVNSFSEADAWSRSNAADIPTASVAEGGALSHIEAFYGRFHTDQ